MAGPAETNLDKRRFLRGALCAAAAVSIWAGWVVVMRLGVTTSLTAPDIAAIRFAVAGLVLQPNGLANAPAADIVFQAFYQGVLTMIVSLVLYGWAVGLLGASGAAAFGALGPVMAALIAIPVLGEYPAPLVWAGILLICAGVYLGSGGRVPGVMRGLLPRKIRD